jgi:transcriptional regulator with XRE-family HTH domain
MKIGEKIRKIREIKGITQDYLASQLNMTPQAFGKIERGETKLDFDRLAEIAKILGIYSLDIMSFDENNIFNNTFTNHASIYNHATYHSSPVIEKMMELMQEEIQVFRKTNDLLVKILESKK